MKIKISGMLLSALILCTANACKEDKKKQEQEDTSSTGSTVSGSQTQVGTIAIDTTQANVSTVAADMVPGSFGGSSSALHLTSGNPCEGTAGFFDCQPNMLKLYLGLGRNVVTMTSDVLASMVTLVNSLSGTGSLTITGEDITKIDYDITSTTKFVLLFHTEQGPFLHLSVDGNVYVMKGNASNAPDGQDGNGFLETTIVYNTEDDYTVGVRFLDMQCKASDIRAPQNLAINIIKKAGIWQGKSMLYMPRWLFTNDDGVTCETASSDALAVTMYTDFVGNDDSSTAALYFIPQTVATKTFSAYAASSLCTNFAAACNNGYGFGDPNPIASYKNNFCIKDTGAVPDMSCTDSSRTEIANGVFSESEHWLAPSELKDLTVVVPDAL